MSDFDEIIVHHLEDSTSFDDQNTVSYRVVGSVDGISINKKNDGFCRVDLILKSTAADGGSRVEEEKVLQTSVVSFHFSKESSKIRSASWCVLKDHMGSSSRNSNCGSVNGGRSESTGKESLESQTVYPSVVSLDPTLTTDSKYIGNTGALGGNQEYRSSGQQAEPKIENPGMDI